MPDALRSPVSLAKARGAGWRVYEARLNAYVSRVTAEFRRRFHSALAEEIRRAVLPLVRRRVPRRTERLFRSLRITGRGRSIRLDGEWYGVLVDFNDKGSVVQRAFFEELERQWRRITARAARKAARGLK